MEAELQKAIDEFLAERRESECGGWAPVTVPDFRMLRDLIGMLIEAKWGEDADGDRPINFRLIDRTTFEPLHFHPVHYGHNINTKEEADKYLAEHLSNLETAVDGVNRAMRVQRLVTTGDT